MRRLAELLVWSPLIVACAGDPGPSDVSSNPAPTTSRGFEDMVEVPGGEFIRGIDVAELESVFELCSEHAQGSCDHDKIVDHHRNETPARRSNVATFEIDRLEVSNANYQACVDAGGCTTIDLDACTFFGEDGRVRGGELDEARAASEAPVVCATWEQAAAYCAWLGKHLPTEDEWEKAARGVDGRRFPWGDRWDPLAANWSDGDMDGSIDGYATVAPVGHYPAGASPYGALDMAGNVWEWVADRHENGDASAPTRVMRGGGFAAKPIALRTTKRVPREDVGWENVGFRCAR